MMSVQTPPLSRSGSSPSNVGLASRSGTSSAPPTSLSLRSSYNQLLGRDVIKESISMDTGSSATLPKSRQRYAMTSVRSAMGLSDNSASFFKNQPVNRGRGLPTKSSSSSALYSSSSSSPFNTTNPKLAKNGANMQRRAESQQLELSRANTEVKVHNDLINNPGSDWVEVGKDNSQLPPFRRRTKSVLEYHGKGWDLDWGNKEDRGEKKQPASLEKEQASPAKEREGQKEEKPSSKQPCQEEKEEAFVEVEEDEEDPTPTPRQPLLPVVVEAPLSPTSSSSTSSPEWVTDNHNHLENETAAQGREELCAQVQVSPRGLGSPAKPPRSSQPRVIKVELHPNNENQFLQQYPPSSPKQTRAAERNTPTRNRAPPSLTDPESQTGLPKVGIRMDLSPDTPSEDEDSSWTTLSQESHSPQTPQETG